MTRESGTKRRGSARLIGVCLTVAFLASGQADGLSGRFIQAHEDVGEMARQAEQIVRDDLYTLRLRV